MDDDAFLQVANNILPGYHSPGRCPDQIVGIVHVRGERITLELDNHDQSDFLARQDISQWQRSNERVIILILESPHTQEYIGNIGPAKGQTGNNIRTLIKDACNFLECEHARFQEGLYSLILLNAIQYQCSLGHSPVRFRDRVFADIWEAMGKDDFMVRIQELYHKGDFIINACTSGRRRTKNWEFVKRALDEIDLPHAKVEHPSNWGRRRNTAIKHKKTPDYGWQCPP